MGRRTQAGHQHPDQRRELYAIGGKLSGLLGYLAFDLGNELVARAYCNEAMGLAKTAGHGDLAAWVRGTQSFIAYYGGRYREALDLARDGQRYARDGPASIRLAISGEARTLGKLGDVRGVDEAVGRALATHRRVDDTDPVGYFLSFDPFTESRIAGNAASAYLAAGAYDRAREFTDQAIPIFAAAGSTASHALTLVDASMTYLTGPALQPDRAGALVAEARWTSAPTSAPKSSPAAPGTSYSPPPSGAPSRRSPRYRTRSRHGGCPRPNLWTVPLTPEQQVDTDDWEAFRRTERMADHWWWRPGWRPDRHYLTWYLVFHDQALADHVAGFQHALADLDYLDPVPVDGMHMTVQGVAFADELTTETVNAIGKVADERCAGTGPLTLTVGPIAAYPGGTFLRSAPWQPVADLRERLRAAIGDVLGADAVPDEPARFKPHISVTYCNATPPADEVIRRLTELRQRPPISLPVTSVDLLELRRDGHAYRWDIRHHIDLTG